MKTWKQWISVAFLGIVFIFIACDLDTKDDPPDPRSDFFATWKNEELLMTLTINASNIKGDRRPGQEFFWTSIPNIWTPITNDDLETKDSYPSGYKCTGTFTEHSNVEIIGNENEFNIFISIDKKSIFFISSSGIGMIFDKQ